MDCTYEMEDRDNLFHACIRQYAAKLAWVVANYWPVVRAWSEKNSNNMLWCTTYFTTFGASDTGSRLTVLSNISEIWLWFFAPASGIGLIWVRRMRTSDTLVLSCTCCGKGLAAIPLTGLADGANLSRPKWKASCVPTQAVTTGRATVRIGGYPLSSICSPSGPLKTTRRQLASRGSRASTSWGGCRTSTLAASNSATAPSKLSVSMQK